MAFVSVTNPIATYHSTFMGDSDSNNGSFLGWIRLIQHDGTDAGYIYLTDTPGKGGYLGGPTNARYVVMARPIAEALTVIDLLKNGRRLAIQYWGEEDGFGNTLLAEQLPATSAHFREDVGKRFGLNLPDA